MVRVRAICADRYRAEAAFLHQVRSLAFVPGVSLRVASTCGCWRTLSFDCHHATHAQGR
jgi:hypothetical protein